MDKYAVKLYARAYRDLDGIYKYIANELAEPLAASKLIDDLEEAILSLEYFPERGAIRQNGVFGNKNYRQLFVKNYVVIYKVLNDKKLVYIVTVRYAPSNF